MGSAGNMIEEPVGEIRATVARISNKISRVDELAVKLKDKLSPILGQPCPSDCESCKKEGAKTELGSNLLNHEDRLDSIINKLEELLDSSEL